MLAVDAERWADLTGRLAGALDVAPEAAELAARWLLGVALQPGRSTARHRQAASIVAALPRAGTAG
jgi:hypothetical protein